MARLFFKDTLVGQVLLTAPTSAYEAYEPSPPKTHSKWITDSRSALLRRKNATFTQTYCWAKDTRRRRPSSMYLQCLGGALQPGSGTRGADIDFTLQIAPDSEKDRISYPKFFDFRGRGGGVFQIPEKTKKGGSTSPFLVIWSLSGTLSGDQNVSSQR